MTTVTDVLAPGLVRPHVPAQRARAVAATRRTKGLDGLRGIAILLVVFHHAVYRAVGHPAIARAGFLGVDLFFVLSGYLITTSLLDESRRRARVRLRRFYARRFLRLVPALALFAAVHVAYVAVTGGNLGADLAAWPWVFGFAANWHVVLGGSLGLGIYPLWSLAVEEQFYLFWAPVLAAGLALRRRRGLVVVIALGIAGSAVLRAWLVAGADGSRLLTVYSRTDARLDALLVGALVAFVPKPSPASTQSARDLATRAAIVFGLVVAMASAWSRWLYVGGFTGIALAAGAMVYASVHAEWGRGVLERPLLAVVGRHSYAIYLWHAAVIEAVWALRPSLAIGYRLALALVFTVVATALSHLLVEKWCFRAMRRVTA